MAINLPKPDLTKAERQAAAYAKWELRNRIEAATTVYELRECVLALFDQLNPER